MSRFKLTLDQIFETHLQTLAITLQPRTIDSYRTTIKLFLGYLHAAFPLIRRVAQLRRDPHVLGWFRRLYDQRPALSNTTCAHYLVCLRRLFDDLAANGHPIQPDLVRREDFPALPNYLPRPLNPDDDQRLQQELRQAEDLYANALLLIRATGIRCAECTHLALDCLRQLDYDQWALHVPLGKLHTERLIPADKEVRHLIARLLNLRAQAAAHLLARSAGWLLPRRPMHPRGSRPCGDFMALENALRLYLTRAAERAVCSQCVTPHRLRHTFATEMLRLGVSLPALMQLMGHKGIQMTLRYLQVTQQDLQREFHTARQNTLHHLIPELPLPATSSPTTADLPNIRQSLAATRYLLEMYRRQLSDEKTRHKLRRLHNRLLTIASELERLPAPKN